MLNRRFYRLGLWIGGLVSPAVHPRRLPAPVSPIALYPDPRLDSVADAVVTCDASGAITYANAAAQELFGPDGSGLSRLCYPSGQPMPPGQSPLMRAHSTGRTVEAAGCLLPTPGAVTRTLDVAARPRKGGATAVFRDVTAFCEHQARETAASSKSETLRVLGAELGAATEAEHVARAAVEAARGLLDDRPDVQARLYAYNAEARRLTRLASDPEDHPKRPRSQRQARPETAALDANDPMLWQVYVAKRPYAEAGQGFALPLLAAGTAVGHLSLTFGHGAAVPNPEETQALTLLASSAALALAGLHEKARASALAAQTAAHGEVARAVAVGMELGALADLVTGYVCRLTEAEVCTLAVRVGEQMRLVGEAYQDALTFPGRHSPDDAALRTDAFQDALSSGKATLRLGQTNPALEDGPWRAFAGQSGRHSILTVPLPDRRGGWTVYWAGDAPLPADQVKFLETLALLTAARTSAGHVGR